MHNRLNPSTVIIRASLVIAFFFIIFMEHSIVSAESMGTGYPDVYPMQSKQDSNREQIGFIQSEIDKISQDLDWLSAKIRKMELFHQVVPERMYQSLAFKKEKIRLLKKLKDQLSVASASKKERKTKPVKKSLSPKNSPKSAPDTKKIQDRIKQYGLTDWVELIKDKDKTLIENRLPILFASGSAEVAKEYKEFLKNVALAVKDSKVSIQVDGYADTDPIHKGKYPSNAELSAARAKNVSQELIKNGISPEAFKKGLSSAKGASPHKASKWKSLDRHANLTILVEP